MRRFLRENGLTLVVLALFLAFMTAQVLAGAAQYSGERLARTEAVDAPHAHTGSP